MIETTIHHLCVTQLTFACALSTIETLENDVKYVQSQLQKH